MTALSFLVFVLVFLALGAFTAVAVMLNLFRKKSSGPDADASFITQETNLENADPHTLVAGSPRAEELRERTDSIAESVRKRIRDRSKRVVSGNGGN